MRLLNFDVVDEATYIDKISPILSINIVHLDPFPMSWACHPVQVWVVDGELSVVLVQHPSSCPLH